MQIFIKNVIRTTILFVILPSVSSFCSINIRIIETPSTKIEGEDSKLHRPEGMVFSPQGDYIAASNQANSTITFYKCDRDNEGFFENTPSYIIQGPESLLNFPHDLSISPDGFHLAVANSGSNSITIYKKSSEYPYFDSIPIAVISGNKFKLKGKQAVKYSPNGNILAVANTWSNTVALYRYQGDEYEKRPYQILQNAKEILHVPDGLAFSSNGELLAVANHNNDRIPIYQLIPNTQGLYSSEPVEILQGQPNTFSYSHSLSFHPSDEYLVVSNPAGRNSLNLFKKVSTEFPRYSAIPAQSLQIYHPEILEQAKYRGEGALKGVAFSPDGNYLGVCLPHLQSPNRAILIFPLEVSSD